MEKFPTSVNENTEDSAIDLLCQTLADKLNDGTGPESVKATVVRYFNGISKSRLGLLVDAFPGGDVADLAQFLDRQPKISDAERDLHVRVADGLQKLENEEKFD